MQLKEGARLGPYEVLAPLGAGGMGEVYRARDTKLGREVAIKTLPEAFSRDPERLARFEREAQVLASLSHPNIAAIYGLEESDGLRFLVLELAPGRDPGGAGFEAGSPRPLFAVRASAVSFAFAVSTPSNYAASADGQRFLVNTPVEEAALTPIQVVLNWTAGLEK